MFNHRINYLSICTSGLACIEFPVFIYFYFLLVDDCFRVDPGLSLGNIGTSMEWSMSQSNRNQLKGILELIEIRY